MVAHPQHHRGCGALRRGRCSLRGADYLLTCGLNRPLAGLTGLDIAPLMLARIHELEAQGLWHVRTSVLMPDHLHLLFTLGARGCLADALRRFKGPLTPLFRTYSLHWQKNHYDHRLGSDEELLPTFQYIFLNPYRAGLIEPRQKWPWYECAPADWEWFGGTTNGARPFPEWLR